MITAPVPEVESLCETGRDTERQRQRERDRERYRKSVRER